MKEFTKELQIRWSDLDPNFHVRHSVYYDFGALIRMEFLNAHGLTPQVMMQHHFGPVLFREEAKFMKELHFGDSLTMNLTATSLRKDYAKFSMLHEIKKGETVCATVEVDGAWIDTIKRKLTIPPQVGIDMIESMPRSADFKWEE